MTRKEQVQQEEGRAVDDDGRARDDWPASRESPKVCLSVVGEQTSEVSHSTLLPLSSSSGLPLMVQTTHHGRTAGSSRSLSCTTSPLVFVSKCAVSAGSSGSSTSDSDAPDAASLDNRILPLFPPLHGTVDLSFPSLESDLLESQEDIAKEAMRLSRQTLSRDGGCGNEAKSTNENQINPRLSMTLPMKLGRCGTSPRLNKFVRRLHDMLSKEKDSGLVEWRRGLLVLKSTGYFAKNILPKYFNTRNFKTFRRQLNYYGFVHIRSFSNAEQSTCALWVNGELAKSALAAGVDPNDVSSVLLLRRVEIADQATTNEMRRIRKELAIRTIEKDLGVSAKALQLQTLTSIGKCNSSSTPEGMVIEPTMGEAVGQGHLHHGAAVSEWGDKLEVESVMYIPSTDNNHSLTPTVGLAEPPLLVSADASMDGEDDPPVKAPASNASAANLLLLLSKA